MNSDDTFYPAVKSNRITILVLNTTCLIAPIIYIFVVHMQLLFRIAYIIISSLTVAAIIGCLILDPVILKAAFLIQIIPMTLGFCSVAMLFILKMFGIYDIEKSLQATILVASITILFGPALIVSALRCMDLRAKVIERKFLTVLVAEQSV